MISPQWYFPWKAARKFYAASMMLFLGAIFFAHTAIRYEIYSEFADTRDIAKSIGQVDGRMQTVSILTAIIVALGLVLITRWYVRPLGRLIQRTRQLRKSEMQGNGEASAIEAGEEAIEDEPGEWQDLERALVRLHRDLQLKTAQLEREQEELTAVVGAVSDAILSIDDASSIQFYNSQFGYLFGSPDLGGAKLNDVIRSPEILNLFQGVLRTGLASQVTSQLFSKLHNGSRYFSVSVAPTRAEGGPVDGAVGVFHDITELKSTEQVRIDFVANASHELRTPLTSLKGYVDTLKTDVKSGRTSEIPHFVDIISRSVDRITDLVSDLLDLSMIESGAEIKRDLVSTEEITQNAVRSLSGKSQLKGQQVETSFQVKQLLADPKRAEQVLTNLIHNAVKYVPEKGRIQVIWESEPGFTVLRVKDNGPGIPPEHQSRLFERFYRVDAGRSRDLGGTGLGLAIVKHIMVKHGGSVRVQSRPGEGAEFVCQFPNTV